MILPAIKEYKKACDVFTVPEHITYRFADEYSEAGARVFALLCPSAKEVESDATVTFKHDKDLCAGAESYEIDITKSGFTVRFRDKRGGANGAATAALLLRKGKIELGTVKDAPDASYRSFMIDMARGLPELDAVKHTILTMALAKYNKLHLHLMDSEGICFRSEALPKLLGKGGAQYTKKELGEIVELCETLCIDIVPEIEIPAHATSLIEAYPWLACDTDGTSKWTLCPAVDELFEMFDRLIGEIAEIFPYEYIHIGSDELEFPDLPKYDMICYWDKCPRCAALRERLGLGGVREEFYYVINRVFELVKAHGKKMMMWNDQIDISKDVPLSREILIEFWRIAAETRGPVEGCSMAEFINKGFTVVNAFYPYTYVDLEEYLDLDKLKDWSPLTAPESPADRSGMILGGEMCAWEFGNTEEYPFYPYTTDVCLALFADKLWSYRSVEYDDEYKKALGEFLFGYIPENDVFAPIGSILPPRSKTEYTYLATPPSSELIKSCVDELKLKKTAGNSFASNAFITLLENIDRSNK